MVPQEALQSVSLRNCNESIVNHLSFCLLSRETLTEHELILARVGIFKLPVSKLSQTMICSRHRQKMGKSSEGPVNAPPIKAVVKL